MCFKILKCFHVKDNEEMQTTFEKKTERTKKEKARNSRMSFPALFGGCHFGARGNLGSVLQMTMQNGGSETKKSSSIIQAQKQV